MAPMRCIWVRRGLVLAWRLATRWPTSPACVRRHIALTHVSMSPSTPLSTIANCVPWSSWCAKSMMCKSMRSSCRTWPCCASICRPLPFMPAHNATYAQPKKRDFSRRWVFHNWCWRANSPWPRLGPSTTLWQCHWKALCMALCA